MKRNVLLLSFSRKVKNLKILFNCVCLGTAMKLPFAGQLSNVIPKVFKMYFPL